MSGRPYLDQRKGSPNWYICQFNERTGQVERVSTRTPDRGKADLKLAEFVIAQAKGEVRANVTLVWVMTRYWTLCGHKLPSRDSVKRIIALLIEHEPETMLYGWTRPQQRAFLEKFVDAAGKPLAATTKRRYFGILKTAVHWLVNVKEELTYVPPMVNEECEDGEGAPPIPLDQVRRLFAACLHPHERLYFLLELTTTPRPQQLCELIWPRVLYEDGVIDYRVPGVKYKLKRRAIAPVPPSVLAYLRAHHSVGHVLKWHGRPLKTFKMTFMHVAERAGVEGYSSYGLRKAGATYLRRNRISELDIKAMLAHKVKGDMDRYAHQRPDFMMDVREAMERLVQEIYPPWLAPFVTWAGREPMPQELRMVGGTGIEPVTPCMSSKRSTAELTAPNLQADGLAAGQSLASAPHESLTYQPLTTQNASHVKAGIPELIQGLTVANDD